MGTRVPLSALTTFCRRRTMLRPAPHVPTLPPGVGLLPFFGLRMPRLHTLDSWLAYRDFRLLWFANFCAFTGQWLQLLSVGWLVKELSARFGRGRPAGAVRQRAEYVAGPGGEPR